VEHQLQAWHWRRHSHRSGQDMPLEGVTGRLHYLGPRRTLLPWLHLADWMQIGSKTTFGFGVIEAYGSD
jgi:CRISPR/Cas system endoribonuclease Cas6 (RAMP superfamily)